jgi:SAM-dependent methyltransferase
MPAQQGALHWPPHAPNLSALVDEAFIPLPDASMDRTIAAHLVENTEQLRPMLRQIWRVLAPSGRVISIVPNRTSLWAQFEDHAFRSRPPLHANPVARSSDRRALHPQQQSQRFTCPPLAHPGCSGRARAGTPGARRSGPKLAAFISQRPRRGHVGRAHQGPPPARRLQAGPCGSAGRESTKIADSAIRLSQ